MSRINIQGTIDNITNQTNVYTPIIEAIVNSIDSIVKKGIDNGKIEITIIRETEFDFDGSLPSIKGINIRDNGEGFNKKNRDSFDTFYSEYKRDIGGKGFGRFMFVKYFEDVRVKSVYAESNKLQLRTFNFGKKYEIIENEKISDTDAVDTYAEVSLINLKNQKYLDKGLETISRKILAKLLVFFIRDDFKCPTIILKDFDGSHLILNDYLTAKNEINQIDTKEFHLKDPKDNTLFKFQVKIFKIYYTGNQKSRVILTANNRAVTGTNLHKYIPEFEDDFFDTFSKNGKETNKNYIIRSYVIGEYLDSSVSIEREKFEFDKEEGDAFKPFSQKDIEQKTSEVTREIFDDDVSTRLTKKITRIKNYVTDEAPWHKAYFSELDLSKIPYSIKENEIEAELQKIKFEKEQTTKSELKRLLSQNGEANQEEISKAISKITEIGKSDLAHYVFNRKSVLQAFQHLLKRRDDGKGELEK